MPCQRRATNFRRAHGRSSSGPITNENVGILLDAAMKTIDELFDDPAERADTLRTVAEELKTLGNDTLSPLGEAHISYLGEERCERERAI